MATCVFFQDFKEQLGKAVHNLSGHTFRIFLSSSAPDAAGDAALTDVGGLIANTNIGGAWPAVADVQFSESSGTGTMTADSTTITASGTVPTFRYYGIFNDSATSPADALVCYYDHGSNVDMGSGDTFVITWNADPTDGTVLTIA